MATDQAALARAFDAYRRGDPARAAQLCREVLRGDPGNAELWCFLGVAQRAAGEAAGAADSYREALRLRPDMPEAWNNLGNALVTLAKLDEALAAYEQVLKLRPNSPEAYNNQGAALRRLGRWAEAAECYRKALRLRPDYADAHNNLGEALQAQGRFQDAEASYRAALRLRGDFPEAHTNLGTLHARQGRDDEAAREHREALRFKPDYAEAHSNLGNALAGQKKYAEAEACYREALRLKPDYAEAHHNLGTALAEQGRLEEAEACYREALRLRPHYADAFGNLATALLAQGRPAEAVAVFDDILQRKPDSAEAHMHLALARLLMGDWAGGWPEYEWRWRTPEFGGLPHKEPLWDGSPLAGRTVLLHAEQGLGDTLLTARYAALVKARGGTVVLGCPKALLRVLAGCPGVDRHVPQGEPLPAFDCYAPLLSLPNLFGTTPESVPADVPYLFPDPALVDHWRRELPPGAGPRVGICWQGNPQFKGDRQRSVPLAEFAPLTRVEGVRLYSLQKGFGSEQLRDVSFPVTDLASRLDNEHGAFVDTAAVMKVLDLVITADTALAHLAGALGVPVWMAVAFSPHWVWLLGRDDSPWYPTMRLFRQQRWGNWPGVFERMAAELRRGALSRRAAPVLLESSPGELLDRLALLEVRAGRVEGEALRQARQELAALAAARERSVPSSPELDELAAQSKAAHEELARAEDGLAGCEHTGDFGPRFVELARAARAAEHRRAGLRKQIDGLLGAGPGEEAG
jgi:Flp pilus assembly protein TadD